MQPANPWDSNPALPALGFSLCRFHWGWAGQKHCLGGEGAGWGDRRSCHSEVASTTSRSVGGGFEALPSTSISSGKASMGAHCHPPTRRSTHPSTEQPSRVAMEAGRSQPPRAVSMVTGTEPSRAFEERS